MNKELSLEIRRQSFHLLVGVVAIVLVMQKIVDWRFFIGLVIVGLPLSYLSTKRKLPILSWFLDLFERESVLIPAKGAMILLLGIGVTLFFFETSIALAAIAILTFADVVSRFGQFFARLHFPWNKHKQVESTVLAMVIGAIAASFFVSYPQAIAASVISMLAESFPINHRGRSIDDNLVVPILAGLVIVLMRL